MKIKEASSTALGTVFVSLIFIVFLPFFLLYLLFKLLATPFDYVKYKRSRYVKDFPHRYKWLATPHVDNEPYTAIKENSLPVEYIKWHEDYEMPGYFVYGDILLNFSEPFFFDKKKGLWLCWQSDKNWEEEEERECEDLIEDEENTDDCLTVEEAQAYVLDEFHTNTAGRECRKVVFFYSKRNVENNYEEGGLEAMQKLDSFIVYEKGELANAIKDFINKGQ